MIDIKEYTVVLVALAPIAFILSIWMLEYIAKKLVLACAWVLGTVGLIVMGEDI